MFSRVAGFSVSESESESESEFDESEFSTSKFSLDDFFLFPFSFESVIFKFEQEFFYDNWLEILTWLLQSVL